MYEERRERENVTDFFHPHEHSMAWFSLMEIMNNRYADKG